MCQIADISKVKAAAVVHVVYLLYHSRIGLLLVLGDGSASIGRAVAVVKLEGDDGDLLDVVYALAFLFADVAALADHEKLPARVQAELAEEPVCLYRLAVKQAVG